MVKSGLELDVIKSHNPQFPVRSGVDLSVRVQAATACERTKTNSSSPSTHVLLPQFVPCFGQHLFFISIHCLISELCSFIPLCCTHAGGGGSAFERQGKR